MSQADRGAPGATEHGAPDPAIDIFISYSRRDIVFARALEAALKRYRPPRGLPVHQRGLRVFRDEADFTGVDYASAIRAHVASSANLVVICSPAARASRYVDEEIRLFAAARGPEHIIPVLAAGLPNNECGPGQEGEKAFPDALSELLAMPLAADYRGHDTRRPRVDRGGFEGPWHKLLADIYGLPRSEVEQREKRRRARLRLVWSTAAGGTMAALAGLAAWALVSRDEAIRQREIAAAGQLTADARGLVGPEPEIAERQALLALEALRSLREHGGDTGEALSVLSAALGRLPRHMHGFPPGEGAPVLAFSGDGSRLFRATGPEVEVWRLGDMARERAIPTPRPAAALLSSRDGGLLAASDAAGGVLLHRIGPSEAAASSPLTVFEAGATCLAFDPEGALVAALRPVEGGRSAAEVRRTHDARVEARLLLPPRAEPGQSETLPCLALGRGMALLVSYRLPDGEETTLLWPWTPRRDDGPPAGADAAPAPPPRGAAARNRPPTAPYQTWRSLSGAAFQPGGQWLSVVGPDLSASGPSGQRLGVAQRIRYAPGDIRAQSLSFPGGTGVMAPNGMYFVSPRGLPPDIYQPLLKGQASQIRSVDDVAPVAEIGAGGRFSTDGRSFLSAGERLLRRWDVATGRETLRFESTSPMAGVLDAPGGRYFAVLGADGSVRLLDAAHPLEGVRQLGPDLSDAPTQSSENALSADGGTLALPEGEGLRLLRVNDGRLLARFPHGGRVVVAPGATRAAGPFGGAFLWPPVRRDPPGLLDLGRGGAAIWRAEGALDAIFSPDGRLAVFAHADGRLSGHDAADGRALWEVQTEGGARPRLGFSGDGRRLVVEPQRASTTPVRPEPLRLLVLDAGTGAKLAEAEPGGGAWLDRDGARIAVARGSVTIAEVSSGRVIAELPVPATLDRVANLAFQPDGQRVVMLAGSVTSTFLGGSWYSELAAFLREIGTGRVQARLPPGTDRGNDYTETLREEEKAHMPRALLSADGRRLAATLYPSRLAYWTVASDRVQRDAVVWDIGGAAPREILRRPGMEVAALSADGGAVLLHRDGLVETWSLDQASLVAAACERLTRNLSLVEWQAWLGERPYRVACPGKPGR